MSNELLLIGMTAVGLAAIAVRAGRFMILSGPTEVAPQRARLVVRDADPRRPAALALQDETP
jgi:hypothetical protein